MNEMSANNRGYDNRDYDNRDYRDYRDYRDSDYRNYRDSDYRDYDNRYYDEMEHGYREDYRNYRGDYRTRDYDRRGGKINNRDYRNYRGQDYYGELEMIMEDMREQYRKIEDISEMAHNQQDKNMLMKIAQKEKENYSYMKQLSEK